MNHHDREGIPEDLNEIAELLKSERPKAGPLELDRIKLRAKASRRSQVLLSGKGSGFMRSRLIGLILTLALLGGGTGALAAAGGGLFKGSSRSKVSANSQYCPPTSQQPGKLKKPGPAKCGKEKVKQCASGKKNKKGKKHASSDRKKKSCKESAKNKKHKKHKKHHRKHKKHQKHGGKNKAHGKK
jgi:hypothetical protein